MAIKKIVVDGEEYELSGGLIKHVFVAESSEDIQNAFIGEFLHDVIEDHSNISNHIFMVHADSACFVLYPMMVVQDEDVLKIYLHNVEVNTVAIYVNEVGEIIGNDFID